jgi:hypothetical protein
MKQIENVVILTRDDLIKTSQEKSLMEISFFDIKGYPPDTKPLMEAAYIFFKDDNGQLRIMKDRYPILR